MLYMERKGMALLVYLLLSLSLAFAGGEAAEETAWVEPAAAAGIGTETAAAGQIDGGSGLSGEKIPDYTWFTEGSSLAYGDWIGHIPEKDLMEAYKGLFIFKLEGGVYCFAELLQDEEVMSYLILGQERALMWDSGLGIFDTRALAEQITDLPITLLNSHEHPDHIGGNYRFDEILCYNCETAVTQLVVGMSHEELTGDIAFNSYLGVWPEGYDPETIYIPGKAPTGVVEDGEIIDLGGRTLEVMYTPEHTDACIMLIDEANHILFTGDMFYPGPIYLGFPTSSLDAYIASMRKVTARAEELGLTHIYCSHNSLFGEDGVELMREFTDWCVDVKDGKVKGLPASLANILMTAYSFKGDMALWVTDFAAAR